MEKQILFKENHRLVRRADGTDEPAPQPPGADSQYALMVGQLLGRRNLSRRPGIHIGDWFLSAELLLLAAILITSLVSLRRR